MCNLLLSGALETQSHHHKCRLNHWLDKNLKKKPTLVIKEQHTYGRHILQHMYST